MTHLTESIFPVDLRRPDNAAPSLHPHYKGFIATADSSVPKPNIGSLPRREDGDADRTDQCRIWKFTIRNSAVIEGIFRVEPDYSLYNVSHSKTSWLKHLLSLVFLGNP